MNKKDLENIVIQFELQNINRKHIDQQRQLHHNFTDFKTSFDRVWHEGLWHVMSKFGIGNDLLKMMKSLYNSEKSYVLLNNQIGTDQ